MNNLKIKILKSLTFLFLFASFHCFAEPIFLSRPHYDDFDAKRQVLIRPEAALNIDMVETLIHFDEGGVFAFDPIQDSRESVYMLIYRDEWYISNNQRYNINNVTVESTFYEAGRRSELYQIPFVKIVAFHPEFIVLDPSDQIAGHIFQHDEISEVHLASALTSSHIDKILSAEKVRNIFPLSIVNKNAFGLTFKDHPKKLAVGVREVSASEHAPTIQPHLDSFLSMTKKYIDEVMHTDDVIPSFWQWMHKENTRNAFPLAVEYLMLLTGTGQGPIIFLHVLDSLELHSEQLYIEIDPRQFKWNIYKQDGEKLAYVWDLKKKRLTSHTHLPALDPHIVSGLQAQELVRQHLPRGWH